MNSDLAPTIVGNYGDDIINCYCGETIGIALKTGGLVVTRNKTRVYIPHPEGVQVGCHECRREWVYCEGEMRLQRAR